MDFNIETDQKITELSSGLGYWLWNLAVVLAPIDTGNLRRSIVMSANSANHKRYVYNTMNAFYLDYLERGIGPIKKYQGFIEYRTVGRMIEEVIHYCITAKTGLLTGKPMTTLQVSSNGPMFHEKDILSKLKVDLNEIEITADDRKYMSRIKYGTKNRLKYERDNVRGSERAKIRRLYKMSDRLLRWGE
jgi:hypothetical protein